MSWTKGAGFFKNIGNWMQGIGQGGNQFMGNFGTGQGALANMQPFGHMRDGRGLFGKPGGFGSGQGWLSGVGQGGDQFMGQFGTGQGTLANWTPFDEWTPFQKGTGIFGKESGFGSGEGALANWEPFAKDSPLAEALAGKGTMLQTDADTTGGTFDSPYLMDEVKVGGDNFLYDSGSNTATALPDATKVGSEVSNKRAAADLTNYGESTNVGSPTGTGSILAGTKEVEGWSPFAKLKEMWKNRNLEEESTVDLGETGESVSSESGGVAEELHPVTKAWGQAKSPGSILQGTKSYNPTTNTIESNEVSKTAPPARNQSILDIVERISQGGSKHQMRKDIDPALEEAGLDKTKGFFGRNCVKICGLAGLAALVKEGDALAELEGEGSDALTIASDDPLQFYGGGGYGNWADVTQANTGQVPDATAQGLAGFYMPQLMAMLQSSLPNRS